MAKPQVSSKSQMIHSTVSLLLVVIDIMTQRNLRGKGIFVYSSRRMGCTWQQVQELKDQICIHTQEAENELPME